MTTADLFPTLRSLPRADKLKVMQFLIAELAKEEELALQTSVIDQSDEWTEQDQADVVNFSLQYAVSAFPDEEVV